MILRISFCSICLITVVLAVVNAAAVNAVFADPIAVVRAEFPRAKTQQDYLASSPTSSFVVQTQVEGKSGILVFRFSSAESIMNPS